MKDIVFTINHGQYSLQVRKEADEQFDIVFRSFIDPQRDCVLDNFGTEAWAISAAKKFAPMYKVAQDCGFALVGDEFVEPKSGRRISVGLALDADRSEREFRAMLT